MHVLTKIFIVLVSLLAVLLVPLVVVYSHNENSYKAKYQEAESSALVAREALKVAQLSAGAETSRLQAIIDQMRAASTKLQTDKTAAEVSVRQLESELTRTTTTQSAITGDIAIIKSLLEASQELTNSLVKEVRDLRFTAVALEREKVQLDEHLRDVSSQLEAAEQARRALAEELARLKDEHTKAMTDLGKAIARGYKPDEDVRIGALAPDKTLTAKVIRVERSSGQVLAEIDAGSRDGVKVDWSMTIGTAGNFIANLRIINVDINRSTGIVSLEDPKKGRTVQVGQSAHAVAGQD
ncbi:MAG: hypothetical protein L0Y44_10405 [Phycisphaerales bacterium]|nr:hypothetical protein [Phycisphaerales bacterium]